VLIGEIAQRDQSRRLLRAERRAGALRDVGQALISSWDVAGIMDALRDHLPRMGISAGFLAMYANPDAPLAQARLMLAFSEQGRAVLEPGGRSFPTRQLVPQDLLPRRRCDLVVEPLFFHEEPIGFFVLEIGPLDGVVYEVLRTMVSSALKGALLFAEAEQQKQQLAASERMMTELAIRDSLTGLFNRRYMEETLERELQRMARKQLSLGVLMIDIDHFKEFNDRFGHPAGDEMLRQLGLVFGEHIRGSDLAYRFGGEEFVLVLPETSLEVTRLRAEQLREKVRQMNVTYADQTLPPVTLSLGVAAFPVHGMNCAALLKAADVALYCAKAAGRDRVVVAGWNEEKDGLTR
jgi:diguanylate cyclase (GGDEF)-like protein